MPRISDKDRDMARRQIIKILANSKFPLTTNEIAKYIGRSWDFTKKNLMILNKKGIIEKIRRKNADYWIIRY